MSRTTKAELIRTTAIVASGNIRLAAAMRQAARLHGIACPDCLGIEEAEWRDECPTCGGTGLPTEVREAFPQVWPQ